MTNTTWSILTSIQATAAVAETTTTDIVEPCDLDHQAVETELIFITRFYC